MKQKRPLWTEKISKHLQELNVIPLFGNATPLNWDELSSTLSKQFGIEDFSVRIKMQEWKEPEDIQKLTQNKVLLSSVKLSPIDTPIYWIMTKSDRDKLTACMLTDKAKKKAFSSTALQEGYYRFLLLEALNALQSLEPIQQMTLQLGDEEEIPMSAGFCIEVEIAFGDCITWGQIVILESFQKNWVRHFSAFPPQYIPTAVSKKIPLDLGVQIGSVLLPIKEWKDLRAGDLLLPDEITQKKESYSAVLTLKGTPLFQLLIQRDVAEITHFSFKPEVTMQTPETPEEETLSSKLEFAEKEKKDIQDIPVQIHVELARLQMSLNELMNLSPGNTLELPLFADKRVILSYQGEKIGVAELVYLGETPGLKILEI